jgi:hypothetical protein
MLPRAALAAAAVLATPAGAAAGLAAAPSTALTGPPAVPLPGPPNGDLAAGLAGWTVLGRTVPVPTPLPGGGASVSLAPNVTLVTPAFVVPAEAQAVTVTARAPTLGALLEVRARPADGGPDTELGVLEPSRGFGAASVSLAGQAGRSVRLVLDPVTAFGSRIEVAGVGPLTIPLPGWTVLAGLPRVQALGARRVLRVTDARLDALSDPFAPGPGAAALIVAVRGSGTVAIDAGGRRAARRADGRWRDLRLTLPAGAVSVRLGLSARPGAGDLLVADLGLVVRRPVVTGVRSGRAGRRVVVLGSLGAVGSGLLVELRAASGARLAATRSGRTGRFRLVARAGRGGRAVVRVAGDRTRDPVRVAVRLPGA